VTAGNGGRALRLFFALWPGERQRARLAAAAEAAVAQVAGTPVPPGNLHVTLAFLGRTPGSTLVSLMQLGGQGPWPAVDLDFERVEYWAKPKVLVAMPRTAPVAGQAIVDRLWAGLEPLGFVRELRPWRPHLTLARRIRRPPPENLAFEVPAAKGDESAWRLALVESSAHPDGTRYRPLADWGLSRGLSPLADRNM
jgi:2'-5' RNA ligase